MEKTTKSKKKSFKMYIPLIAVLIIVGGGAWYWYTDYMKYVSTDDAHVDSDNVSISSKILGRIIHIYGNEGDSVKAGQLMVELDSADLLAQRKQAIAAKEQAMSSVGQAEAKYNFDQENIKVIQVTLDRAKEDFDRAKQQFSGDVITKEQFEHSRKALESAQAQLNAAQAQLEVSKALIASATTSIESTNAQIGVIETQLKNTKIYAPIGGIIAKRWLLAGDITQPGQAVYTVTSSSKLWVSVFIEETKVSTMHIGQSAEYTIDAFSGLTFTGKIVYIGSNTASQFSLIPPNNASGNFTKVTQRVMLKLSIDGTTNKTDISKFKILAGMSAVVKIIKNS